MASKSSSRNLLSVEFLDDDVFGSGTGSLTENIAFPFRTRLSFGPLIKHLTALRNDPNTPGVTASAAYRLLDLVDRVPTLLHPMDHSEQREEHRKEIVELMTIVFPSASQDLVYRAAMVPFVFDIAYATPPFSRYLLPALRDSAEPGGLRINLDHETVTNGRILRAYLIIARRLYGMQVNFDYPLIFTAPDTTLGLDRHFQMEFDPKFVEIVTSGAVPRLSSEEKADLRRNLTDIEKWKTLLPPDRFSFEGFSIATATDVTNQTVISRLKRLLVERGSIVSDRIFKRIQELLRTLLQAPDINAGIAAIEGESIYLLRCGQRIDHGCIMADSAHYQTSDFEGSLYETAVKEKRLIVVEDLAALPHRSPAEEGLLNAGICCLAIAPLFCGEKLAGTLELSSPTASAFDSVSALKLRETLPLFAIAIRQSIEDFNTKVQTVIKEKCTAIHPSVEWKFRSAAQYYLEKADVSPGEDMEPIVFDNVYPLFGVSDIRSSSIQRNAAIQSDLTTHLDLAQDVVSSANRLRPLPVFDEVIYRAEKLRNRIEKELDSSDEFTVLEFIRNEVESLFQHVRGFGPEVELCLKKYEEALESSLGTVYRKRKAFEQSVAKINETISTCLETAQIGAQEMFPHYFERHRTDGIEHAIYIGASIADGRPFDRLYLRNLRLWQLIVMCRIARQTDALRSGLDPVLETAHLILVQGNPLTLRFRLDEKRFDVEGAYDIRYEIMKKRIDKATFNDGAERLTQPGRIAIVYSHTSEAAEYRNYIDFLISRSMLDSNIEDLEIDPLQGLQGLRALRVKVNLATDSLPDLADISDLATAAL